MDNMKFLVDLMLGRLAKWLRIWGYDAEYFCYDTKNTESGRSSRKEIAYQSLKKRRIILTRDHKLSRKKAYKLVLIKSNFFEQQLKQLMDELGLKFDKNRLFGRCTFCNVPIEKIEKRKIFDKVPRYIYAKHDEFSYCPKCNRVYWPGSHLDLLEPELVKILK